MMDVPAPLGELARRLDEIYGGETARAVIASMGAPKRICYWRNPFKPAPPDPDHEPLPGLGGCYLVAAADRAALMGAAPTMAGSFYPINPSSVIAARALAPQPEHEVLDLAAAPGGKTLQLAALMGNRGRIAAVEPVRGRFHRLRANLERCGVENVDFYLADGRGVGAKVPGRFDRVLLDAPCSSEARIRLHEPLSYSHWKPRKIKECARKQQRLLASGFRALKPGGRLLYCTCAFAPEENELVVAGLLERNREAALVPLELPPAAPVTSGLTHWRGADLSRDLALARRVLPGDLWDGFFLCLLERRASAPAGS